MPERLLLTGGEAVAHAMRQIDPDVVPVYPITPQTPIIQGYAKFVADGRAHGEMVDVESEHSAMSAAIGAALSGARTITATSSQGLALMAEVVYIAAAMRAPIVVALGNRALSGPINIHCDHSDSMLVRDSGVIQLFVENAQEAYDAMLLATRLAEHPDVLLPVFVCQDGFTITHSAEPVELLPDEDAARFVGDYAVPFPLLDVGRPTTQGPFAMPDYYYELRHQQVAAMAAAGPVLEALAAELETLTGRRYGALERYRLDGARRVAVALGSTAGTLKEAVDSLREEGEPAGLVELRSF
ncbi:MAG: pyruvate ferredoxin oxidoreductase, partial [Gaiellaceae bacterium]